MSQLGMILQESVVRERETRTILCFLREQMDGVDGARRRRRSLKERLGLKGMGCCGTTWVFGGTNVRDNNSNNNNNNNIVDDDEEDDVVVIDVGPAQAPPGHNPDPLCVSPVSSGSGMNLAAALAAERHLRASHELERVATVGPTDTAGTVGTTTTTAPGTPFRVSLMRLLEETDGGDEETTTTMMSEKEKEKEKGGVEGNDSVCCVCMVRKKGAAFIPCGHTFCRVCSRELWLNRGSCPLCNRSILEILDIF